MNKMFELALKEAIGSLEYDISQTQQSIETELNSPSIVKLLQERLDSKQNALCVLNRYLL